MALKNHVFPLFLKGSAQVIGSGNAAAVDWNGKTSLIYVDGADTVITSLTLGSEDEDGAPVKEGTIVTVRSVTGSLNVTVDASASFVTDTDQDQYTVQAGEDLTMIYLGYETDGTEAGWAFFSSGSGLSGS